MKDQEPYRTFIGLPLEAGPAFLEARAELVDSLSGERISWVDPDRYHITLRFIGDTMAADVEAICRVLQGQPERPLKFRADLTEPGSFGPRKRPRVVWIGLEPQEIFRSIKSDVDCALQKVGIPMEEQPFRAHLTLGRVRSLRDLKGFYKAIDSLKGRFTQPLLIERLVFYHSVPGREGPRYKPLCSMEFRD